MEKQRRIEAERLGIHRNPIAQRYQGLNHDLVPDTHHGGYSGHHNGDDSNHHYQYSPGYGGGHRHGYDHSPAVHRGSFSRSPSPSPHGAGFHYSSHGHGGSGHGGHLTVNSGGSPNGGYSS